MIVTAGAIDCHVHFICPQLAFEAISSGELYNWKYFFFKRAHDMYVLICIHRCID